MTGVVYKSTGSWYHIKDAQGKLIPCRIKGKFRIEGLTSTNPVAVGDVVEGNAHRHSRRTARGDY